MLLQVTLSHKVMQYVHFWSHTEYFLLPWKIPEGLNDRCSSMREYVLYQTCVLTTYNMEVVWPDIDASWKNLLCLIFAHTAFLICGAEKDSYFHIVSWCITGRVHWNYSVVPLKNTQHRFLWLVTQYSIELLSVYHTPKFWDFSALSENHNCHFVTSGIPQDLGGV